MQYQNKSFTQPTTNRPMSDQDYEVAVGLRCAECKQQNRKCQCED